ncbi:MAG: aldo/keto reductase [Phycisphaerales bacterium]|nr:aldo/keto reductase [Phycisphaerales bacterium]
MNQRALGKSDIKVSQVSLGCWTLGGRNWNRGQSVGWADVDEGEAVAAIHDALDAGVNHFDNADVYGNGKAERMLAKALGSRRKDVTIATKVGHFPGTAEHAYDALHIRHQCEQSLKNLNTDHIDLYYFHHGDFGPDDRWLDAAVAEVNRLKDAGKIRAIGLSAYSADDFVRLVPKVKPVALQSWAHMMDDQFIRPGNPVPKLMAEHGLSFVAFSPLNQGILLDKYDPKNPPKFEDGDIRSEREKFQADGLRDAHAKMQQVKERFGASTEDLARVALQYILAHDHVACVIPGFRNRRQVQCNLSAADKPLSPDDVKFLREVFAAK